MTTIMKGFVKINKHYSEIVFASRLGGLKSVRFGKCQKRKVSDSESVTNGNCHNWKMSELESDRIGKCQNRKVSEFHIL